MSDRRTTPVNARVAAAHLADAPPDRVLVTGEPRMINHPVVDLCREPGGSRDRQLLWGDDVQVYEDRDGWSFVQAGRDGYVGYVPSASLARPQQASHWVCAPACHVYDRPDIKSPDRCGLSLGSRLAVVAEHDRFLQTSLGYVPRTHLRPLGEWMSDPVSVAAMFLGTPYLWGGNSRFGIDCSGLVQAALRACGQACPGDSDQQERELGQIVTTPDDMRRGDLLFWKGHVAMVADADMLIQATAHHMAVVHEPIRTTIQRIKDQGEGSVTAHKRL